jgi:hypothetical protein
MNLLFCNNAWVDLGRWGRVLKNEDCVAGLNDPANYFFIIAFKTLLNKKLLPTV